MSHVDFYSTLYTLDSFTFPTTVGYPYLKGRLNLLVVEGLLLIVIPNLTAIVIDISLSLII